MPPSGVHAHAAEVEVGFAHWMSRHKYKVKFEVDGGNRFFRDHMSILVEAISYGRRFSGEELAQYVDLTNQYLSAVGGSVDQSVVSTGRAALIARDFPVLNEEPLYKYISDETWRHVERGSFQLGTAEYYRQHSNANVQDRREGTSTFHLVSGNNQLNATVTAGFNCVLFCGTSYLEGPQHTLMLERFGGRRIKIDRLPQFIDRIRKNIGAFSARPHNIVYTDLKNYTAEHTGIERFSEICSAGGSTNLSDHKLRKINAAFFSTFYKYSLMPSLFSKPTAYKEECERRIVFEFVRDSRSPTITVNDKSLLDFVTIAD